MTRIFDASYGQVQEFLKRLAIYGLTKEEMLYLKDNPRAMREWIATLSSVINRTARSDLNLPVATLFGENDQRVKSLLSREYIRTIGDLTDWTYEELKSINNCGEKTINFIRAVLNDHGLNLSTRSVDESVRDPDRVRSEYRGNAIRWWPRNNIGDLPINLFIPVEGNDPGNIFLCVESVQAIAEMPPEQIARDNGYGTRALAWLDENYRPWN